MLMHMLEARRAQPIIGAQLIGHIYARPPGHTPQMHIRQQSLAHKRMIVHGLATVSI